MNPQTTMGRKQYEEFTPLQTWITSYEKRKDDSKDGTKHSEEKVKTHREKLLGSKTEL